MPISIDIDVEVSKDASSAIRKAQDRRLNDALTKGWNVSVSKVPQDTGQLLKSIHNPEKTGDGSWQYGTGADYATVMEEGTQPFYPPIEPLLRWSKRVTGDEGLGWYVARHKIPEEGIDAQPFMRPGAEAAKQYLENNSFGDYLEREL